MYLRFEATGCLIKALLILSKSVESSESLTTFLGIYNTWGFLTKKDILAIKFYTSN